MAEVARGRYEVTGHLGGPSAPALAIGGVAVRDDGRLVLLGLQGVNRIARLRSWAGWSARDVAGGMRTQAREVARRLPNPAKETIRGLLGRLRG